MNYNNISDNLTIDTHLEKNVGNYSLIVYAITQYNQIWCKVNL